MAHPLPALGSPAHSNSFLNRPRVERLWSMSVRCLRTRDTTAATHPFARPAWVRPMGAILNSHPLGSRLVRIDSTHVSRAGNTRSAALSVPPPKGPPGRGPTAAPRWAGWCHADEADPSRRGEVLDEVNLRGRGARYGPSSVDLEERSGANTNQTDEIGLTTDPPPVMRPSLRSSHRVESRAR